MFRRVLLTGITGFMLMTLCSAQDGTSLPAPNTIGSGAENASPQTATAPAASGQTTTPPAAATSTPLPPQGKKPSKKASKKNKTPNPIADVDSKQPDKVLFDRAEDAIKHGKYDIARLSLQTLINTYPDSEYVARAKLAIGDSWYDEGGAAAFAQAESEYKDFITFFPNMPEAAEAQMKIANIHYREMEKADRDPTHAMRAEDEYRQMILQFPDSPLIPQAKQRLLEVQEVLARREYDIGHFYYMKDSYPAAIARLKSVADTYPLFSGSDDALFELGGAYEKQVEVIRRSKLPEAVKGEFIKEYTNAALSAYDRILTVYPLESRAPDARKRLEAMKKPIPKATPQAVAADKAQIASRGKLGTYGKVMENFHKAPDVAEAAKTGEPTLVDPKQASAPEMVRSANETMRTVLAGAGIGNSITVEKVNDGALPPENAPIPHSTPGNAPGADAATTQGAAPAAAPAGETAGTEMKSDLPATGDASSAAPLPAPNQVNDLANSGSSNPAASTTAAGASGTTPAASSSTATTAPPADTDTESSSKKKKKKHLLLF
jgi:outer membrane protein assembly factor BamD